MTFYTLIPAALLLLGQAGPFAIEVVDEQTGRGVPLIELKTVNEITYVTDSNGLVAFDEPGLMDQTVFFHVKGHGYEYPEDGFGFRGVALKPRPGGHAQIKVKRLNVAQRLYRITGQGIYADTVRLGRRAPISRPLLNGQVFGSDSVNTVLLGGRIHWFWGDTNRPSYPLGNFHSPTATSLLPQDGGLDPEVGINLEYAVDERGFAHESAKMPGEGPTWIGGLVVLRDPETNRETIYGGYVKVRNFLDVYQHGILAFDADRQVFRQVKVLPEGAPMYPTGHAFKHVDDGTEYAYFMTPYAITRVKAHPESFSDLAQYEGFTPLVAGTKAADARLDRGPDGALRYGWKRGTAPLSLEDQEKLTEQGALRPGEALLCLRDYETGRPVRAHSGTIAWNDFRKRWVMIALEVLGTTSVLGEIWYAESDATTGPWAYGRRIVTHDKYSFYNPKHHPFFDKDGGRIIFFEGTYTTLFSGLTNPTPRYEYNQILYKLELDDPRLNLPVAFDSLARRAQSDDSQGETWRIAFYAHERPTEASVPVYAVADGNGTTLTLEPPPGTATPIFHALPSDVADPPEVTAPLYAFRAQDGKVRFGCEDQLDGHTRDDRPICRVWTSPVRVDLPRR